MLHEIIDLRHKAVMEENPEEYYQSLLEKFYGSTKKCVEIMKNESGRKTITYLFSSCLDDVIYSSISESIQGSVRSLAPELSVYEIRVNSIVIEKVASEENVKKLTEFLANDRAYIQGQTFYVNARPAKDADTDEVALVTGSGQGIGFATASELAASGRKVLVNDLKENDALLKKISSIGAVPLICDISKYDEMAGKIQAAYEQFGHIDIFVANAAFMDMKSFESQSFDEYMKHININVKGHIEALKHVIPIMKKQGHGKIILMGSMFGVEGWKNATAYAGTKAAMQGLGRSLSLTLGKWNISTTIIAPGIIDTPQLNADARDRSISLDEMKKIYAEDIPLKRLGKDSDVAYLIRFLCDGGNDFLNGSIIQTNGGESRADVNWGLI